MNPNHPTALHAFLDSLEARPDALAVRIIGQTGAARELTHADLFLAVGRAAEALDDRHARTGDRLVLSLPTSVELIALYLGALFRGVLPLIEPSPRLHRGRASVPASVDAIRRRVGARWCVVPRETLESDPSPPEWVSAAEDWMAAEASRSLDPPPSAQLAHLQPTSGSTGAQKVAIVTHGNIAANIGGIGRVIHVASDDALLFWLPLFHDMGLIAVSCSLYWQCPMTVTDPSHFVRNPIRFWLRLMSQYRATITAAPNSAYEACARLAAVRRFDHLDLSTLRAAFWGAEPVFAETVRRFEQAFGPYGYRPEATLPVYGLAEATLAATVPDVDAAPVLHRFDGESTSELTSSGREMVSVGRPLPDHEIRVVDSNRQPVGDGCVGEIEIGGPSVIEHYWSECDPPRHERVPEPDGFLRTGDLACRHDNELYVVGRKKDLIIIRGRNFIPSDIEVFADRIVNSGINGGVAAFGVQSAADRTECLHLAIESRILPPVGAGALEERLRRAIAEEFGIGGATIHWVGKGVLPKTTSGKIQRFRCAALVDIPDETYRATTV